MTAVATFNPTDHPRDQYGRFRETQSLELSGAPKSFSGLKGEEWGNKEFSGWSGSLTPEQDQGIRAYSNQEYVPINNFLRGKGEPEPGAATKAKALTDTIRSSEIPEDVTVHRMLSDDAMVDAMFNLELEGAEFRDEGLVSTTMDPDMLGELDLERGEFPIFAEINVPKGTKGAAIGAHTGFPEEQELLLGNGITFKVTKADLRPDNTIHVKMDIVEQDI